MALDAVTLGAAKKYTDEKVQQIVIDGGGVSPEERDNIAENTKVRHSHSNKDVLDLFGINYANTYPTFKGQTLIDNLYVQNQLKSYVMTWQLEQSLSKIPKFDIEVVETLPTENISETTVYLLKDNEIDGNLYTEYIYVDGIWETLGSQAVDLSGYAKLEDIPTVQDIIDALPKWTGGAY